MKSLLQIQQLGVSYGGLRAVDDVNINVQADRVMGLISPNGAGKTTTIDAICGFVPKATGTIELAGQRLEMLSAHHRARAGLVRTFQSVELFDDLTIRENLIVAANAPRWYSTLMDAIHPRRGAVTASVSEAIEMTGINALVDQRPTELSHGQRRIVGVARALAGRPKLVLLDEPAAGLDPSETDALGQLIVSLPQRGIGVLLVDHDMTLVLDVCDDITVLDFGRVIATGTPHEIRGNDAVVAAYLGSSHE